MSRILGEASAVEPERWAGARVTRQPRRCATAGGRTGEVCRDDVVVVAKS